MSQVRRWGVLTVLLLAPALAGAAPPDEGAPLRVRLSSRQFHVNVGVPIWIEFLVENDTDEPITLFVPGTEPEIADDIMGLPMEHVFSGEAFGSLSIRNEDNRTWDVAVGYQPPNKAPVVTLGAHRSIGALVDIRAYYPALRTPGTYRLKWAPYGGRVESNILVIKVAALKQARIVTDQGEMTVRFFYADAPRHIDNFIELAKKRFYDGLTFHRIESGFFIQGGCPNGDGTGIRPNGVKIGGEFSDRRQTRGMISMALLDEDPGSASCQFFITNTDVPEWDGKYTIFGQLVGDESYETLDRLMATATNGDGKPLEKLSIRTIRITEAPNEQQYERPGR